MALRSDGTLLVWGWENFGLRGDGIPRFSNLPVPTPVTAVSGVTRIAMAGNTILVLASAVIMPDVVGELGSARWGNCTPSGCPCGSCPCQTLTDAAPTSDWWSRRSRRPAPPCCRAGA